MEIRSIEIKRREVVDSQSVHHDGIDPVDLFTVSFFIIHASSHIKEHNFFRVPQHCGQVMTEELEPCDSSLIRWWEHDWLSFHGFEVSIIDEDFIGNLLVDNGC